MSTVRVEFDTSQFRFSHGKAPRGFGSWAFGLSRNPDVSSDDVVWAHQATFVEAKAEARRQLAARGVSGPVVLWVLP